MSINNKERQLTYGEAIYEAISQEMANDDTVFVLGQGVDDPKGTLGTTLDLHKDFGAKRSFDVPIAEDGILGVAIGAALAGLRPINVHIRVDFLLLCMNQLINMAAKSNYMFGGKMNIPLVLRGAIGRSWGQGAQHSQAFHSFFMHTPGLKVVAPTFASDAKGSMISAIRDDNPVVYLEHRMLYSLNEHVPIESYASEQGKARVLREGSDITIVGISHMVVESLRAQKHLKGVGISAEIIDPIWLSPLDIDTIVDSVKKTRKLLVVDTAWLTCGVSSEICIQVIERLQFSQKILVDRMGYANTPCPTTKPLENMFYPNPSLIASKVHKMIYPDQEDWFPSVEDSEEIAKFRGPF